MSHSNQTGCTTVAHLEAVDCREPACVAALLQQAGRQRAVGATAANERSSRSHMVFTLSVTGLRAADGQQLNGARSCPSLALLGAENETSAHAAACPVPDWLSCPNADDVVGDMVWTELAGLMPGSLCRGAQPDRPGR